MVGVFYEAQVERYLILLPLTLVLSQPEFIIQADNVLGILKDIDWVSPRIGVTIWHDGHHAESSTAGTSSSRPQQRGVQIAVPPTCGFDLVIKRLQEGGPDDTQIPTQFPFRPILP